MMVACGSYSPVTFLHLRMFEMALDYINDGNEFEVMGAYFRLVLLISPVSDAYNKVGLISATDRVKMCQLATQDSEWIMVDSWEALQIEYVPTAKVLSHFDHEINTVLGGCIGSDGKKIPMRIVLLAGGDLIQSFAVPNLWKEDDVIFFNLAPLHPWKVWLSDH